MIISKKFINIFLTCLVLSMFYLWQHIQIIKIGYETENLKAEKARLVRGNKILQIEIAKFRSLSRIENLAIEEYGFIYPERCKVITILIDEENEDAWGYIKEFFVKLKKAVTRVNTKNMKNLNVQKSRIQ